MKRHLVVAAVLFSCAGTPCAWSGSDPGVEPGDTVAFNLANLKRGRQLYAVHCVSCHGMDGRGDTEMREFLKTPPADLSDDEWIYGSDPAATFDVVRAGRTARDMPAFAAKLDDDEIWLVIRYMEYLGGRRP